jgi:hypothetical protein
MTHHETDCPGEESAVGASDIETAERRELRLKELFACWDDFYGATTPVHQADALLAFANEFHHYRAELARESEAARARVPSAQLHLLGAGDRVRFSYRGGVPARTSVLTGTVNSGSATCFISVVDDGSGLSDAVDLRDVLEVLES